MCVCQDQCVVVMPLHELGDAVPSGPTINTDTTKFRPASAVRPVTIGGAKQPLLGAILAFEPDQSAVGLLGREVRTRRCGRPPSRECLLEKGWGPRQSRLEQSEHCIPETHPPALFGYPSASYSTTLCG
jgi:hypothetical protein